MLIELWERIRGYDRWVETSATIESSQVTETPVASRSGGIAGYTYGAGDVIAWTDPSGEKHYADFNVDDKSPLYQYVGGESVAIRYDPANPDQFYYRDLLKSRVNSTLRVALGVMVLVVLIVLSGWLRSSK